MIAYGAADSTVGFADFGRATCAAVVDPEPCGFALGVVANDEVVHCCCWGLHVAAAQASDIVFASPAWPEYLAEVLMHSSSLAALACLQGIAAGVLEMLGATVDTAAILENLGGARVVVAAASVVVAAFVAFVVAAVVAAAAVAAAAAAFVVVAAAAAAVVAAFVVAAAAGVAAGVVAEFAVDVAAEFGSAASLAA